MRQRGFPIAVKRAAQQRSFRIRPLNRPRPSMAITAENPLQATMVVLLSAGSLTYGVVALALFGWLAFGGFHFNIVPSSVLASFKGETVTTASRESFLRQVNFQQKRDLAAQIKYVSNIIVKSGKVGATEALKLSKAIVLESKVQNLDPLFVAAVIKTESTFNRQAVSSVGATGLMQIMPDTGKLLSAREAMDWRGSHTLRDPVTNLRLGIAYLKQLKGSFKNSEHALIAYNWGPGNLSKALKERTHIPSSTVHYAKTVMRDHKKWQADYSQQAAQYKTISVGKLLG